jgi:hypothetical protein
LSKWSRPRPCFLATASFSYYGCSFKIACSCIILNLDLNLINNTWRIIWYSVTCHPFLFQLVENFKLFLSPFWTGVMILLDEHVLRYLSIVRCNEPTRSTSNTSTSIDGG